MIEKFKNRMIVERRVKPWLPGQQEQYLVVAVSHDGNKACVEAYPRDGNHYSARVIIGRPEEYVLVGYDTFFGHLRMFWNELFGG